jgi:mycothione reductase
MESEGFAKAIVARDSRRILGFHIIGPYAPILIQEVVNAMQSGGHGDEIGDGIHIHPALSELVPLALSNLEEA